MIESPPVDEDLAVHLGVIPPQPLFLGRVSVLVVVAEGGVGAHLRHPTVDSVVVIGPADHHPPDGSIPRGTTPPEDGTHVLAVDELGVLVSKEAEDRLVLGRHRLLFSRDWIEVECGGGAVDEVSRHVVVDEAGHVGMREKELRHRSGFRL